MERQFSMADSIFPGFSMADDYFRQSLTNGDRGQMPLLPAGNHHLSLTNGDRRQLPLLPAGNHHLQPAAPRPEISPYCVHYISTYDSQLESQFSQISLTRSPAHSAATPAYNSAQTQPSPEEIKELRSIEAAAVAYESDLRMMRIQSAARALNTQPEYDYLRRSGVSNFCSSIGRLNGGSIGCSSSQYGASSSDGIQPNNSLSIPSLRNYRGMITSMATNQHHCGFLQKKIEDGNLEDIQMIFVEIKNHVCELMMHPFGNYLIQKLLCFCNEEQMDELLMSFTNDDSNFCTVCTHAYGARPVQAFIDSLTTNQQRFRLMSSLRRNIVALSNNPTGIYHIKHCLWNCSIEDNNKHILNGIADNCLEIATDKNGCCLVQDCVTYALVRCRQTCSRLISEIASNTLILSENVYGNYVVQQVLRLGVEQVIKDIMSQLRGNYVSLCMNKHGSHVVERCLEVSKEHELQTIIVEILNSPNFLRVLQDPYGNYVAQSALGICKGAILDDMIAMIQANYSNLQSHPYGKLVLERTKEKKK